MPRLKPSQLSPGAVHNPHFTLDEVYRTLVFYRDCPVSAHKIAVKRGAARFMKQFGRQGPPGCVPVYVGPVSIDLIVLKEGHTIADAIQNFDIDICKCSWDGLG